ncbi:MAG: type II secretion system F family protein [Planctomycetaceae bacterium]
MAAYRITARTHEGSPVTRDCEAPDPDALLASLGDEFAQIESVVLITSEKAGRGMPPEPSEACASDRAPRAMSRTEAAEIGRQISELTAAQLPLESGLAAIAAECPSRRVREALLNISERLSTGANLEEALRYRGAPAELQALIQAGARSGNTAEILEQYVESVHMTSELRQSLWFGLLYPAVLLGLLWALAIFVGYWAVPAFVKIFDGFDLDLPLPTLWLVTANTYFTRYGWHTLLAVTALVVLVFGLLRLALGRVLFRKFVCRVPVVGAILRSSAMARFTRLLALLVENRVPLQEALLLAGNASGDAEIAADCRGLIADVSAGETLESAAFRCGRFPPSFARSLGWQERAGGLPEILRSLGDQYAGRVRLLVAVLQAILPPFVMLLLGAAGFFLLIALFTPLIELLNKLS